MYWSVRTFRLQTKSCKWDMPVLKLEIDLPCPMKLVILFFWVFNPNMRCSLLLNKPKWQASSVRFSTSLTTSLGIQLLVPNPYPLQRDDALDDFHYGSIQHAVYAPEALPFPEFTLLHLMRVKSVDNGEGIPLSTF
jgi:hypothetical protein